jgi:hypothetical protein
MSSEERLRYFLEAFKNIEFDDTTDPGEEPTSPPVEVKEKKRPKKCQRENCNHKISLTDYACKCENFYCMSHRHAESHACSYDYKGSGKEKLEKQLQEVKGKRIEKI